MISEAFGAGCGVDPPPLLPPHPHRNIRTIQSAAFFRFIGDLVSITPKTVANLA